MKKTLIVGLATLVLAASAACGSKEDERLKVERNRPTIEEITVRPLSYGDGYSKYHDSGFAFVYEERENSKLGYGLAYGTDRAKAGALFGYEISKGEAGRVTLKGAREKDGSFRACEVKTSVYTLPLYCR